MGCRGRTFWDCTRTIVGCLEEEQKEGKEKCLGDFGKNECGNMEE